MSHVRSPWPVFGPFSLAVATAALLAAPLRAQCPQPPLVHAENVLPGVSGPVTQLLPWDPDGAGPLPAVAVAGGVFAVAGDALARNVARLEPASGQWTAMGSLPVTTVNPILGTGPQGELYALASPFLRRWTGSSWAIAAPMPEHVGSLAVLPNGDVVLGGSFADAGGVAAHGLARWDGFAWHDLGLAPGSVVFDLRVRANGSVSILGDLIAPGSLAATGVASWANGTLSFPAGAPARALTAAEHPNGDLLVVTMSPPSVVRHDGVSWNTLTSMPATGVVEIAVAPNGDVYVGGGFTTFEGVPAASVARLGSGVWSGLGSGVQGGVNTILPTAQGVIVGGNFGSAGGATAVNVARWNGAAWSPIAIGIAGIVHAILPRVGGDVVVAGNLPSIATNTGAVARHVLRRSYGSWSALGSGTDARVLCLAESPNGDVVAGGTFAVAGGVACNHIARWNGSSWLPLGSGTNAFVHSVATAPNGDVIAGGYFSTAGGLPATSLARWNGSAWSPRGAFNGGVEKVLVLPNGELVVGGAFTAIDGQPRQHVARFDGTAWQPMGAGLGYVRLMTLARGVVHAVDPSGAWRWDGTQWVALPSSGLGGFNALATLPDGDLVVADGLTVRRFDGAAWVTVVETSLSGMLLATAPQALAADARGQLWIGGGFASATPPGGGQLASPLLLGVDSACPALALPQGAGCVGSAGLVQLTPATLPWVGSTWRARATGIVPSSPFAIGLIGPAWPVPLQSVVPQGLPGCTLHVLPQPELLLLLPALGGAAELAIPLPPAAALVGAQLLTQVVPIEFGSGGVITAFSSTNALLATIGAW